MESDKSQDLLYFSLILDISPPDNKTFFCIIHIENRTTSTHSDIFQLSFNKKENGEIRCLVLK